MATVDAGVQESAAPLPAHASTTTAEVLVPGQRLRVSGRLDSRSAHELRRMLDVAIAGGTGDLLVDVEAAEIHDSTGLGMLVGAHRRAAAAGRRLVMVHPSERFERLVRAARLGRVLHRVA